MTLCIVTASQALQPLTDMRKAISLLTIAVAWSSLTTIIQAEDAQNVHADALPQGALTRLGTIRFRPKPIVALLTSSPAGNYVATYSVRSGLQSIEIWDKRSGQLFRKLDKFQFVSAMELSPDGISLAVSNMSRIEIWNIVTGERTTTLQDPLPFTTGFQWTATGERIIAWTSRDGHLRIWEVKSGERLNDIESEDTTGQNNRRRACFSGDGSSIFVSGNQCIQVYDAATSKSQREISLVGCEIKGIAISDDGKLLAACLEKDGLSQLAIIDRATGKKAWSRRIGSIRKPDLRFLRDGRSIAITYASGVLNCYEAFTGEFQWSIQSIGDVSDQFVVSGSGDEVLTARDSIAIWNSHTGLRKEPNDAHPGAIVTVSIDEQNRRIRTLGYDGIREWDAATAKPLDFRRIAQGTVNNVARAMSADGRLVATCAFNADVERLELLRGPFLGLAHRFEFAAELRVFGVAFSPDNKFVAALLHNADGSGRVRIYDIRTKREIRNITTPGMTLEIAYSADGRWLAWAGEDITIWNVEKERIEKTIPGNKLLGGIFEIQANATRILLPSGVVHAEKQDQNNPPPNISAAIALMDWPTGKVLWLSEKTEAPSLLVISPDGSLAASAGASEPYPIQIWSMATGKRVAHFEGHQGTVTCMAFSADNRILVSGSSDTSAIVWNLSAAKSIDY
ncbi:MAG: WD40 repeat domain-containing protein [Planctomycetes bacterium]|nr:WD40 repeat domain-containing protein [Planctomycetota bacterium]